jgi:antitoxin StbD
MQKIVAIFSADYGADMESILADVTVSMSEFKKNPAAVLREANNRPVAVLNHNRAAFYMVEPPLFEALMEELADQELYRKVLRRMADKSRAVEVEIDSL